jgi:hypothetical protein
VVEAGYAPFENCPTTPSPNKKIGGGVGFMLPNAARFKR